VVKRTDWVVALGLVIALALPLGACQKGPKAGGPEAKIDVCKTEFPPTALATIGDEVVTAKELDGAKIDLRAKNQLFDSQTAFLQTRRQVLDDFLFGKLVEKEAVALKTTSADIVAKEVTAKIKPVSEQEAQKYYDEIKEMRTKGGQQTPPYAQVGDQIRSRMKMEKEKERRDAYFMSLAKKHAVKYVEAAPEFNLPRMAMDVGALAPKGAASASVTIVEFSDFQCPFCSRAAKTIDKVMEEYKGRVKLYFRHYPLNFHPNAKPAALAAHCANDQDKFWKFHDMLFANQQKLDRESFVSYAKELKLDVKKFEACFDGEQHKAAVEKDMQDGEGAGVSGTPAFFINGVMLSGNQPIEKFREIIDQELKSAKEKGAEKPVMP